MSDCWVVNASPIIALAKVGRLALLQNLCAVISSAADVLKSLRAAGLRLDDQMTRSAVEGVGETWTPSE